MAVPSIPAPSGIPFSSGGDGVTSGSGVAILVALLLLGCAYVALLCLRKRGWAGGLMPPRAAMSEAVSVEQRLRLGPACTAVVLRDGESRLLIVESRQGLQVIHLAAGKVDS